MKTLPLSNVSSPSKNFFRWLAVLPGAFITEAATAFVVYYLMWLQSAKDEAPIWFILRDALPNGLSGATFVFVGVLIAPRRKKAVSIALSVTAVIFF